MRSNTALIDVGIAIAVAVIVLTVSPGLAITAIVAIFVLLVCGITFVFAARRAGSRKARRPQSRYRGR